MSVACDGYLTYGWAVKAEDIPNLREHEDNEWEDVFGTNDRHVILRGYETHYWACDLVTGDDDYKEYEDQTWYVGIPLRDGCDRQEFMEQLGGESELDAIEVYRRVTGKEPSESPKVLLFTVWS
jgi:hypothetical protein